MNPSVLIEEGIRLQRQGALADAAMRYAQVLRLEPANTEALHRLAQVACQQGQFQLGVDYARQALTFDPRRARTHLLLGMALGRLGQPSEALASFDRAVDCAPDLADAHANRGDVLAVLGRPAEALTSYDRALALKPDEVETWCNRGAALHDLRRFDEALTSYDRAIALKSRTLPKCISTAAMRWRSWGGARRPLRPTTGRSQSSRDILMLFMRAAPSC